MNGGGNAPPPPPIPAANGGEFLLSLLQKPQATTSASPPPPPPTLAPAPQSQPPPRQQPQQSLAVDPAVAAVGPSLPFPPPHLWQSNGQDLLHPLHWPLVHSLATAPSPFAPNGFLGFPHSFFPTQFQGNQVPVSVGDDHRRLGFPSGVNQTQSRTQNPSSNLNSVHGIVLQKNQLEHKLKFGSLPSEIVIVPEGSPKVDASNSNNLMNRSRQVNSNSNSIAVRNAPPPGFSSKPRRMGLNPNAGGENSSSGNLTRTRDVLAENVGIRGDSSRGLGLSEQLDRPGPPSGSNLRSVKASDVEDSMMKLENAAVEDGGSNEIDDLGQRLVDSLLVEDESDDKNEAKQHKNHREKDSRSDSRGQRLLNQRMRAYKRQMRCRVDIDRLNDAFIMIVKSLIPAEEEKAKQQQLLTLLEKLIIKEWPTARLYLYGSCANSFGVSKSDVDLCLVMEDMDINKAEVLLKLADILQSDNLQNVQALTRARVPIVKLMDPATGISCDICINNVLAVVNTRLLRDYARIDMRLRHLAFIVKHWAKSRGVNETYQGTLSSYAYVLMCIHFLQQRRPAILPCLQGMEATYSVTVDNIECAYFDQVEKLRDFGSQNKDTVSQLVWGFFNYWAYRHDYTDSVISVRTGSIISKREKDWTRRIGNDRHLICIEDPFETSHDLGRVVDKHSIRVLREEFERAAEIMQFDPNPCVTLFEPYIPG